MLADKVQRAIFWMQSPLVLLGGICIYFSIPLSFTTGKKSDLTLRQKLARIDYLGAVTLVSNPSNRSDFTLDITQVATITSLLVGLSSPHIPLLPTIFAPPIFVVFIFNEIYYASDPIIPVIVLRSPGTLLTCLSTLGFFMARWSVLFYTPVYAIAVRGWAPASAGSMLVPTNAGFALGNLLTGFFHIKRAGSFYSYVPIQHVI